MTLPEALPESPNAVREPHTRPSGVSLTVGFILLVLATFHCAASLFFVNYSYLDLKAYAAGTERMPYQGRIGMMPILLLAEHSPRFVAVTASIDRALAWHGRSAFQNITPEELACIIAGVISLLASVAVAAFYGLKRCTAAWWLPPALLLAMLYITQSARYETAVWYPYDLPHAAIFGTACLLIMEGAWIPVLLLFLIDMPVRETGIFLVSVCITVSWARGQFKQGVLVAGVMIAAWIPFRIYIQRRFVANPTEFGMHYHGQFHMLLNAVHWPQIMSVFGFMLVPLCLGNRLLSRAQRAFMLGALPCLVLTLGYGVWPETRIFGEWLLPASVLLTAEIVRQFPPRSKAARPL